MAELAGLRLKVWFDEGPDVAVTSPLQKISPWLVSPWSLVFSDIGSGLCAVRSFTLPLREAGYTHCLLLMEHREQTGFRPSHRKCLKRQASQAIDSRVLRLGRVAGTGVDDGATLDIRLFEASHLGC